MKFPKTEPIHNKKELDHLKHHTVVSAVYYGSRRSEQGYKNFTVAIGKFRHQHMRFGHSFGWSLKKLAKGKLPCIEVYSHMKHNHTSEWLCSDLDTKKIEAILEGNSHEIHRVYDHRLSKKWFINANEHVLAYFHKSLDSLETKAAHRVFHQFSNRHGFQQKIGEVNVLRVD